MKYIGYVSTNGKLIRKLEMQDSLPEPPANDDEIAVIATADAFPDSHYYDGSQFVEIPISPGSTYVFNYDTKSWVDTRTQEQYDAYKAEVRSKSCTTRYDFLHAVSLMENDFTDEDLQMLARGEFPAVIQSVLDNMPAEESKNAQLKWSAMNTVCRTDALIVSLAAAMGFSEFDLDDTFGIVLDPPPV